MGAFTGTLNISEIVGGVYNMIINQEVFADNLGKHQTLVDKARIDGGMYGDTRLYYATDCLESIDWVQDSATAINVLEIHRPKDPEVQAITLNIFREIPVTVDNYMTKRAFATEGAFAQYNGVVLAWIRETKKVYDGTIYNTFIGTNETAIGKQNIGFTSETDEDVLTGQEIANQLADLLVELGDYSREFNDYGFLRSYADDQIKVIWNSKYVNRVKKMDLPQLFHKEGLIDKFDEDVLPSRYFGIVQTTQVAKANVTANTYRSMIECDYATAANAEVTHVFPGDYIPAGTAKVTAKNADKTAKTLAAGILANEAYKEDDTIICKITTKYPPYMSAFEVGTSFFNARNLSENHYLTFGHNTIEAFKDKPFITVRHNIR